MGSSCALCIGLSLTWITLWFLPAGDAEQYSSERSPLGWSMAIFAILSAVSGWSFYGQLRERRWRHLANLVLLATLTTTVWHYWPQK